MYSILRSIAVIGFTGAVAYTGVTGAFFTDSESSVGNVFTAGTFTGISLDSVGFVFNGAPAGTLADAWDAGQSYGKFFNFSNIVPGDRGVRHLSLHNDNTAESAYVCFNTGTVTTNINNAGEEIHTLVWRDDNFNRRWDPANEPMLTPSPTKLEELSGVRYGDSTGVTILGASHPSNSGHIAVAWCAGTIGANPSGSASIYPGEAGSTITCDGGSMTTQGGSYVADMIVYAEQVSNNSSFTCAGPIPQ